MMNDAQICEWSNALNALRKINAEWSDGIDFQNECLSNLFELFGEEDLLLTLEDMLRADGLLPGLVDQPG